MKTTITLSVICLLVIIAVITNPKKEEHIDNLTSKAMNHFIEENPQQKDNPFALTLGNMAFSSEIQRLIKYNNYILFSTTSTDKGTISIGLFGNVIITFDSEKEESQTNTSIYKGKINDKYPITMEITIDQNPIKGQFIYDKIGIPIRIEGELTQNQILLNGFDANNKMIDIFKGTLKKDEIIGKWSDGKGNKSYDFQLIKQQVEVAEKSQTNKESIPNKISITSIRTGFGAMSRGWRPAILINLKNTSNQDISKYMKITAIFFDTETNKEIGIVNKSIVSGSEPFLSGLNKDILLYPSISYKGSPTSLRLKAKVYIDDKFIKEVSIAPEELY